MNKPQKQNRDAWDDRARRGLGHTESAGEEQFSDPWKFIDDCGWLGRDLTGKRVLCLAAGGGWHGPLFASVGADVTVVDISPEMLARDQLVATNRGFKLRVIEGSMDHLPMLADAGFDVVIQPVSTCYLPHITQVYLEVARVTAPGGVYISQHKQPANLQGSMGGGGHGYTIVEPYYRTGPLPPEHQDALHREGGTLEYLHRWEELLGGLCRSGFVIEDVVEPRHGDGNAKTGTFRHRSWFIPPYITLKARRTSSAVPKRPLLWVP